MTKTNWLFKTDISGGRLASILQKVSVPIMENTKCQEWFSDKKKSVVLSDRSMCAGFEAGGKDACQVSTSITYTNIITNVFKLTNILVYDLVI